MPHKVIIIMFDNDVHSLSLKPSYINDLKLFNAPIPTLQSIVANHGYY